MKKFLYLLIVSTFTISAVAGPEVIMPVDPVCFDGGELQVDGFFSGLIVNSGDDFYGGGIGINYYFTQNIGVGASWALQDINGTVFHDTSVDLLLRAPLGDSCNAIYGIVGGGVLADGENFGSFNYGLGLEHRFSPSCGIFGEARHKFIDNADFLSARVGFRLVF